MIDKSKEFFINTPINIQDIDTNIYILSFFFICLTFFINDLKEATINGDWDLSLKKDYERKD